MPPKKPSQKKWKDATKTWDTLITKYADEEFVLTEQDLISDVNRIMEQIVAMMKEALVPELDDVGPLDRLQVVMKQEGQNLDMGGKIDLLRQQQAADTLIIQSVLKKLNEMALKTTQNAAALDTVKKNLVENKELMKLTEKNMVEKFDKGKVLMALTKKVGDQTNLIRAIDDKLNVVKKEDPEDGEIVDDFQDGMATAVKVSTNVPLKGLVDVRDWSLEEFLATPLGLPLSNLLTLMAAPDADEWKAMEAWWNAQKARWTRESQTNLIQWYRTTTWHATMILNEWQRLIADFMANPFQLSLQEICQRVALVRNSIQALGIIHTHESRLKWAGPFTDMVQKLLEKTDLKVGRIKNILMTATPRKAGPIWTANRESKEWEKIENERIYAMSSTCDKKEYMPAIRCVTEAMPSMLIHLAETNGQLSEVEVTKQVKRLKDFVQNLVKRPPSFLEFRNSDSFDEFKGQLSRVKKDRKRQSTPTKDELDNDYTEEELQYKSSRYHY